MALHRDLFWVLGGRIATAVISVASLRIITALLEPKDFGLYALLIAFQGFCGLILISPVGLHINRHTHAWWDSGSLLKRLAKYNRYLVAVSSGVLVIVMVWWLWYPGTDRSMAGALFSAFSVGVLVYVSTWNSTLIYILNMLGFRGSSVGWGLASAITGLFFSSLLTLEYHSAMSWLLGQGVGMAVGAIGAGLMLNKHHSRQESVPMGLDVPLILVDRKTILIYCMPLAVATGLLWLQNTGYRFWVGSARGAAELGILVIGLSISAQIWAIIESLATQFLSPYFFRHITEAKSNLQKSAVLSDWVNVMWPVYAVLAGFNVVFASSLLVVLTNEQYHAAVVFVMLGGLIEFVRCTGSLWSYAAQIERKTTSYIIPYGLGALIVWLGVLGVSYVHADMVMMAVVLVVSGLAMCVAMVLIMQRMVPVKLAGRGWVFGSAVFLACLLSVVFAPIKVDGFILNVGLLTTGLLVTGGIVIALLWRNPALMRLLAVSLRNS